jgi:hypothetical protein
MSLHLERIRYKQRDTVTLIFVSIYGLGRDCSSNWKRRDESRLYLLLQKNAGVMIFAVCSANGICGFVFAWFWWIFVVCSACLCTSLSGREKGGTSFEFLLQSGCLLWLRMACNSGELNHLCEWYLRGASTFPNRCEDARLCIDP